MSKVTTRAVGSHELSGCIYGPKTPASVTNDISLLKPRTQTLVMKYRKQITLFAVRIIGKFVISVMLDQYYLVCAT
jgi:hypothetical protein